MAGNVWAHVNVRGASLGSDAFLQRGLAEVRPGALGICPGLGRWGLSPGSRAGAHVADGDSRPGSLLLRISGPVIIRHLSSAEGHLGQCSTPTCSLSFSHLLLTRETKLDLSSAGAGEASTPLASPGGGGRPWGSRRTLNFAGIPALRTAPFSWAAASVCGGRQRTIARLRTIWGAWNPSRQVLLGLRR